MCRVSSTSTASSGLPSLGHKIAILNLGEEAGLPELLREAVGCDAVTLAIQIPFADKNDLLP